MAELIVAGLAVASTPPALFVFERLNDAFHGKKEMQPKEQKPKLGEAEDELPNLLRPKNAVKANAGKKEEQKLQLGETEDVLPNLLRPKNAVKGNAGKLQDQQPFPGEAKDVLPNLLKPPNVVKGDAGKKEDQKDVLKGNATNKVSCVSKPLSLNTSSRSKAAEMEPKSQFSLDSTMEHDATNPYLLKIPSDLHREQDTSPIVERDATNPYLLKIPSSHHMERDTSSTLLFYVSR